MTAGLTWAPLTSPKHCAKLMATSPAARAGWSGGGSTCLGPAGEEAPSTTDTKMRVPDASANKQHQNWRLRSSWNGGNNEWSLDVVILHINGHKWRKRLSGHTSGHTTLVFQPITHYYSNLLLLKCKLWTTFIIIQSTISGNLNPEIKTMNRQDTFV